MSKYVVRRLFTGLFSLVAVTMIVFGGSRLYGDPLALYVPEEGYGLTPEEIAKVRKDLHLDQPFPVQYAYWLKGLFTGDLGIDLQDRRSLGPKLKQRLMPTLMLAGLAWGVATVVGVPLGVLAAVKRGTFWDFLARGIAIMGHTLPSFWIAIVAILVFSVWLRWLPSGTMGLGGVSMKNFVLPVVIMAWLPLAGYTRLVRSAMLEILDSEFIKLARAKGVSNMAIIWKHAFRNALISPLTYAALLLAGLVNGSIAIETVFAWPGVARWGVQAVWSNNFNVVALTTLVFTAGYVILAFFADILYAVVDPRIRY